jgi:hypothetical protein
MTSWRQSSEKLGRAGVATVDPESVPLNPESSVTTFPLSGVLNGNFAVVMYATPLISYDPVRLARLGLPVNPLVARSMPIRGANKSIT